MKNITQIFLATDFMEHSECATKKAVKMSKELGVPLSVIHVFNENSIAPGPYYPLLHEKPEWLGKIIDEHRKQGQKLLDNFFDSLGATGKKYFLEGDIKTTIVQFVENNAVPLLVVGAQKNKPNCISSVSEYIVRNAHCSVLLVPGKK